MRDNPLQAAQEALRIATDAVQRAQVYYDYQGKTPEYNTLCTIKAELIQFQRQLLLIEQ